MIKVNKFDAPEGTVSKFVFEFDNAIAEAVLYKYPTFEERTVICCSTQSGCAVGCTFCGASDFFVRNLTSDEIVHQVSYLLEHNIDYLDPMKIKKLQIMFMSMGEPFNNYNSLARAIRDLHWLYPHAALLVSTSAPLKILSHFEEFIKLSIDIPTVGLQFSVHESNDIARKKLIPTSKVSLSGIAKIGNKWHNEVGRRPFFNYCVHNDNNSDSDVSNLVSLFNPSIWNATISVICEKTESVKAAHERQLELTSKFQEKLLLSGYNTRLFNPAGQDSIGGGCGQLWYVQKWARDNGKLNK